MPWKPTTAPRAVPAECPRCGAPCLRQREGLPFDVLADTERLTPEAAAARTTPNRLAWCLRESKWTGARLVEVLGQLHSPVCPWPHVVNHQCPPGTPAVKGALW
ncbi:hypothetical protein [Streptomyces sp. C1-2]|uniref:hypothetical protein n=1 Tax=Streptomyces sp. C1-2 TaxID=2720022 RepID=UPI0014324F7E|nr:hypothetical protein [Streptomyces sp. C1-2]NJP70402.1 hypothetical protein [Streptomyces sp. C1-2]